MSIDGLWDIGTHVPLDRTPQRIGHMGSGDNIMPYLKYFVIFAFFSGYDVTPDKDLAEDPFLRPYVLQLKKSTPADDLRKITGMAESELILLHHGLGTGIRNKWLRGNRDPELIRFFREKKINDPDEMSIILIEALWRDLNSSLSPEQRASVEKKRAIVARKRETYEKLEAECEAQLTKAKGEFERCYANHGLPSKNPVSRDPFFKLIVEKSGRVRKIVFFEGASPKLKTSLTKTINTFIFSEFSEGEFVTLYILDFPECRIAERDTMHN